MGARPKRQQQRRLLLPGAGVALLKIASAAECASMAFARKS